jgi:hypothetical protein
MIYIISYILCIVIFIMLYSWYYTQPFDHFTHYVSNKLVLYYNTYNKKHIKSFSKLKKLVPIEIIQDSTYKQPTIIYYYNNLKIIYPEKLPIKSKSISRFFKLN